jgi:exonuclease SbcD
MGSGFAHGRINPETGQNTRLEDFVKSLSLAIDLAISEPVDLVLFGGDAFPDATPAPYIQQAFAGQFRRLVDAEIPTVLLVGNHDQHSQGQGGASLSIYRTLGVPGVVVGDNLTLHTIDTPSGTIQVITLPWLNRATLLTREGTENLSLAEVNKLLIERLEPAIEGKIRKLDPDLPTILLGHLMVDNANLGAERLLAVGKGFTIPLSLLTRSCFDYVALGHVHRHQNLNKSNNPPVVYPGSIDRVDFSEEKENKGYVTISIEPNPPGAERKFQTTWEFCPLPVRPFRTIKINAAEQEDPQTAIMKAIEKVDIQDAVVRLIYQVNSHQSEQIDNAALHEALKNAHHYTIQAELISQLSQPRLPELGCSASDPMHALSMYLENRPDLKDIASAMIAAAEDLLGGNELEIFQTQESPATPDRLEITPNPTQLAITEGQLKLL